ncbi:hypothetical protein Pmani_009926 [Petrolisthes manimaculis]|uniref:Uncharacterized protein n=1 Tax=Petrolisthes manimaculis TaxID=1843537 RepID=A0AAE1Q372_9EUCA|nr:hypothetical protein Pmani_009926 [Petrolisthes manimaculis]
MLRLKLVGQDSWQEEDTGDPLGRLVVLVREFETFDNDVGETVTSVLRACGGLCRAALVSDQIVYPSLVLPPRVSSLVLTPDLLRPHPNIHHLLSGARHVLLLPDGARCSSSAQLRDLVHLLEGGDAQVVTVGVGGTPLTCHRYTLQVAAWTLTVAPAPQSVACDAVSGRAALLLHAKDLLNLTHPMARPLPLSIGVQGAARGWKLSRIPPNTSIWEDGTPPCCLEGLRATARHIFQVLKGCRAQWWLEGGTLLGTVHSGDIIPWDYDVDIGIYAADVERCPAIKAARWQTLEDGEGFVWQRAPDGNFFQVHL